MKELGIDRGQLERGIEPFDHYSVSMVAQRATLPKGMLPEPVARVDEADYSHLNTKAWATHRKNGRKGGKAKPPCQD